MEITQKEIINYVQLVEATLKAQHNYFKNCITTIAPKLLLISKDLEHDLSLESTKLLNKIYDIPEIK